MRRLAVIIAASLAVFCLAAVAPSKIAGVSVPTAAADACAATGNLTPSCGSGSWYCSYVAPDYIGPYGETWLCYHGPSGYWYWTSGPFQLPW